MIRPEHILQTQWDLATRAAFETILYVSHPALSST